MLEEGRAVLWSLSLEGRAETDAVRGVAPELAARLEACSLQLQSSGSDVGLRSA